MNNQIYFDMSESFGTLSDEDVKHLELSRNICLPDDYRKFLICTNGGYPKRRFFQHPNFGISLVDLYFGLKFGEHDGRNLESSTDSLKRISDDFNDVIYIGSDPGGLAICLGTSKSNQGSVYLFDHDSGCPEIKLLKISGSFYQFFNSCFETVDEAEAAYNASRAQGA